MTDTRIHRSDKAKVAREAAALVRSRFPGDPIVGRYATALDEGASGLDAALAPLGSASAEVVATTGAASVFDEERDDAARALFWILLAYATQRHDPALALAAAALLPALFPNRLAVVDLPLGQESAALDATVQTAAEAAARLAALPGVPAFVTALAAAQARFAETVTARPAQKAAVTTAVSAIREADQALDGVLQGYVGAVKERFPGRSKAARAARDLLLQPLTAARATAKARGTRRRTARGTTGEPT